MRGATDETQLANVSYACSMRAFFTLAAVAPNRQRTFRVPEVFAGILTLGLLGYSLNLLFLQLERYLLRWRPSQVQP